MRGAARGRRRKRSGRGENIRATEGGEAKVASSYFVAGDTPLREGGGEPSLEYYEDPYGSLRMPLSIWVILRIYNEDAMLSRPSLFVQAVSPSFCFRSRGGLG